METWPMTDARARLPELLDRVRTGRWQTIGRRGRCEGVVADADELSRLLGRCFPFSPHVYVEEKTVGIYLDELDVQGIGSTLQEAQDDLVDAALEYAEAWHDHLRVAPNHRERAGYVHRLEIAGDRDAVTRMLFGEEVPEDGGTGSATVSGTGGSGARGSDATGSGARGSESP